MLGDTDRKETDGDSVGLAGVGFSLGEPSKNIKSVKYFIVIEKTKQLLTVDPLQLKLPRERI